MAVHNHHRVVAGLCPNCEEPVVVSNDGGTWDLATCRCDWKGGIDELDGATLFMRGEVRAL